MTSKTQEIGSVAGIKEADSSEEETGADFTSGNDNTQDRVGSSNVRTQKRPRREQTHVVAIPSQRIW